MKNKDSNTCTGAQVAHRSMKPSKVKVCFVVGPYRSGTSMVSRILSELGAWPGPDDRLFPPTHWNPGGYIQRPDVTAFNTWLIEKNGGTLNSPGHPMDVTSSISAEDFERIDLRWILNRDCILIKDPRFCFTLAGWMAKCPILGGQSLFVRVRRNVEQAALSALSHYDVRHYCGPNHETALAMLSAYDDAASWQCRHSGVAHYTVCYEDLLADPAPIVNQLACLMGCKDEAQIRSALRSLEYGRSIAK
jgi:hypothetical protein